MKIYYSRINYIFYILNFYGKNMIRSMTAYARSEKNTLLGTIIWEIRSLNKRYFDLNIRVPDELRYLEPIVRDILQKKITRGKIECILFFHRKNNINNFFINEKIITDLLSKLEIIKEKIGKNLIKINPFDILKWPEVMSIKNSNLHIKKNEFLILLKKTIKNFIQSREKEGKKIKIKIKNRLSKIKKEIKKIRKKMPEILQLKKEKLLKKIEEIKINVEKNRIEQEILFLINRIDIEEELERLEFHIEDIYNFLLKKKPIGKRLDFIIQEFSRESNTITSKSINYKVTKSAIEIKILTEQMREQIQNIE